MEPVPLISFFSGGGFLDLGFETAGYKIIWSNEVNQYFADMYQAGLGSWRRAQGLQNGDIKSIINRNSILDISAEKIRSEALNNSNGKFFGIIGGPPCQDFSHTGRDLGVKGERGKLTQVFIDLICELNPHFFVMENVPGLYRRKHRPFFNTIRDQLENFSFPYLTSMQMLNALNYGVPQNRERLILIGFRQDMFVTEFLEYYLKNKEEDWFSWPTPKYENVKELKWPLTSPFGEKNLEPPDGLPLELTVGRLLGEDSQSLPNGEESFIPYSKKFKIIKEGDVSGKSFKRLHRYRYSPTVWYGHNEVHLHPWKPRRLTVREALRIQTVPDEYVLPEEISLTQKFKMISNGVPTVLAHEVAESVLNFIKENNLRYTLGKQ